MRSSPAWILKIIRVRVTHCTKLPRAVLCIFLQYLRYDYLHVSTKNRHDCQCQCKQVWLQILSTRDLDKTRHDCTYQNRHQRLPIIKWYVLKNCVHTGAHVNNPSKQNKLMDFAHHFCLYSFALSFTPSFSTASLISRNPVATWEYIVICIRSSTDASPLIMYTC